MALVALPEVERLSPACIRILGGNPGKFTLQGTNTYLVGTGARRLLVDTGEGKASWAAALRRTLAEEKATLAATLITHWHPDHVGGIDQVRQLVPGVPVYQNQEGQGGGGGGQNAHFRDSSCSSAASFDPYDESNAAVRNIEDGQAFRVDGATLRAVHTPGHTVNHMVFVLAEEDALFAGDNVLGQGTAVFEDLAMYLQSLARMRTLYAGQPKVDGGGGGSHRLYPGHGPVVADGPAKITEYIGHRQQREDQVVMLLRWPDKEQLQMDGGLDVEDLSPNSAPLLLSSSLSSSPSSLSAWTAMELVEIIYADVRRDLHGPAERGLVQILCKLETEGKVVRQGHEWRWKERSPL